MAGAAVLLLAGHRSDTQAQTFNDAIQGALDGGAGDYTGWHVYGALWEPVL